MRGVAILVVTSLMLLGCHGKKNVVQQTQPPSTLKVLDLEQKPGFVEQHRLGMMTIGNTNATRMPPAVSPALRHPASTRQAMQPLTDAMPAWRPRPLSLQAMKPQSP